MDEWQMRAWVGLIRSSRSVMHNFDLYLRDRFGLSFGEVSLMAQLHIANGDLAMVDLARNLVITKAGLTKMVDRLERENLVSRAKKEEDRRVVSVVLTKRGLTLLERIRPAYRGWVRLNVLRHVDESMLPVIGDALLAIALANGADVPELKPH